MKSNKISFKWSVGKMTTLPRREIIHLRKRYYFGFGYRCIKAIGKGNREKMTTNKDHVTCQNCLKWYIEKKKKSVF